MRKSRLAALAALPLALGSALVVAEPTPPPAAASVPRLITVDARSVGGVYVKTCKSCPSRYVGTGGRAPSKAYDWVRPASSGNYVHFRYRLFGDVFTGGHSGWWHGAGGKVYVNRHSGWVNPPG